MVPARRGFTLVELLVVIGIIGVLVAITIAVGTRVVGGGKERQTRDTLTILENSLSELVSENGGIPSGVETVQVTNASVIVPIADAIASPGNRPIDTVAWYMLQARRSARASAQLATLDARVLRAGDPGPVTLATAQPFNTVIDGWGRPIRYVHPRFSGTYPQSQTDAMIGTAPGGASYAYTQLQRQPGDADLGMTTAGRPYFYSAGPDGDFSTTADNVYSGPSPKFARP